MTKKLTLVKKYCVGGRLLDLGCGTGDIIKVVKDDFKVIVGIDISHYAVQFCRRKFCNSKNIIIVHGSHEDLEKPGYLDCITALDVLEHLEYSYALTCVMKFFSITKPGGLLIITTTNWHDKIFRILDKNRLHKHAHSSIGWRKKCFPISGISHYLREPWTSPCSIVKLFASTFIYLVCVC
jgi:2-polyprenyl-3-methyl-5-hydroxy-6-metoxy-1,4-benzoquinol methylase